MKKDPDRRGMMCPHCEARVKKALEALPQVDEAVVSHEAGTAIVTLNAEVDDEVLKKDRGGTGLPRYRYPVKVSATTKCKRQLRKNLRSCLFCSGTILNARRVRFAHL